MLDTRNIIIPVSDEIENTQKYLEIESIKHSGNFKVFWDIDQNVKNKKTIKLILQPIIENAFVHGIQFAEEGSGIIKICIYNKNNTLVYSISNNGSDISPEKIAEIKNLLKLNDLPKNDHIGLYNVNQRIKTIYGDAYGCNIDFKEGITTITVSHPC